VAVDRYLDDEPVPTYCNSVFPSQKNRLLFHPPRYPKLDQTAHPVHELQNGKRIWATVGMGNAFDLAIVRVAHDRPTGCQGIDCEYVFRIEIQNRGATTSPPGPLLIAIVPRKAETTAFGTNAQFDRVESNGGSRSVMARFRGPYVDDYFALIQIQANPEVTDWNDANIDNDTQYCSSSNGDSEKAFGKNSPCVSLK
jgi:hypothetical protein